MGNLIFETISNLLNSLRLIPGHVCVALICIYVIGVIFQTKQNGVKKGLRQSLGLLLIEYIILFYLLTIVFRLQRPIKVYNFQVFYSYFYDTSDHLLLIDNILNVFAFIPIGLLLVLRWDSVKWWMVFIFGGMLSFSVELMQFVFQKGNANIDDVIHNTTGCLIGYLAGRLLACRR